MVARSDAREADIWPGVNLNDPRSPEAQWLEAAIKQCNSLAGKLHRLLHGVTIPPSTPRQLSKPAAAEDQSTDVARATQHQDINQLTIQDINTKKAQIAAASAAATQDLLQLEAIAMATGMLPSPSQAPSIQPSTDSSAAQSRRLTNQHRRLY